MPETDQMPEERHMLREHVLEMFVRAMIINSYDQKKDAELKEELEKEKTGEKKEPSTAPAMPLLQKPQISQLTSPSPQEIHHFQQKFNLAEPRMHPSFSQLNLPRYNPIPLPQPSYQPTKFKPGQKIETVNLGKLAGILTDPSVFSIECPGPYKNLLVNRSGSIQTSALALTPEEINSVMHNISEQTRIPITPGVFRAAVQDLIVTAVMSDFVGTRFVIQKRNPFQRF